MQDNNTRFYQTYIIEGQMLQHCGPIFFLQTGDIVPTNVYNNGTFGLVDTGSKRLLVTCAHVWSEFSRERRKAPSTQLAVLLGSNRPIFLPDPPIAFDEELDLAIFDMVSLLSYCSNRAFYPIFKYPPVPVRPHDPLAILGYPAEARNLSKYGAEFAYSFVGISVADVSGWFIHVDMETTKRYRDSDGALISRANSLGGFSGSPVYRLMSNGLLVMVGFVTSSVLGTLRISHIGCLREDGTIITAN